MASSPGHIELERAVGSITVGARHRTDLGDLGGLIESIRYEGLLQPITITPDGVLVCGARRLAALRALGIRTVNVWVRAGISDRLGQLLAEQDDNRLHKPLTPTEQATLYRELKAIMTEDAIRRQEATRFTTGCRQPRIDGGATVAPPSDSAGKTRAKAALMVTGRRSYTTLERINELQNLAADDTQPNSVRERAVIELNGIDAGGSITAAHQRTHTAMTLAELDHLATDPSQSAADQDTARTVAVRVRAEEATLRAAELDCLAADALARVRAAGKKRPRTKTPPASPGRWEHRPLRAFVHTWADLVAWWEYFDIDEIAEGLTVEQWTQFTATVNGTVAFSEAIEAARRNTQRDTT